MKFIPIYETPLVRVVIKRYCNHTCYECLQKVLRWVEIIDNNESRSTGHLLPLVNGLKKN